MEVPAQNMTDHRERDDRFRLYRLVQRLLPKDTWQVVLFDEVEDVFAQWGKRNTTKAGVNHVLETNPVPAIWITNDIHCMDDAFLRRFDIVLNLKSPPASQRERILAEAIAPMQLPRNMLKAIAAHPEVTPAIITRAALVVKTCTPVETMSKQASERVLRLVNGTLTSQGCSPVQLKKKNRKADTYRMETPYDLAHVNTSIALPELACALRETGEGRVCLFGPPGTGKSAFVHELARQMKRKLIVCQPSDIQDKYLGETEKNMAQKFKEARKKKAILFFDEFDSFLMTREMHSRTWETSQVNEMLTQIERFNGILFAATNHRTVIDKAAMRRFDFKVDFNWMKPEQAYGLFCKVLQAHGGPQTPDGVWQQQLAGLPQLSPGDFAVAARQARLMGKREGALTPEKLFSVLQAEVQAKRIEGESRPMGFLATLQ